MQELNTVIPQRLGEVFAWLGKQGIAPAGAPFIRYLVIDMDALLDSELGVPVATALSGDGCISAGGIVNLIFSLDEFSPLQPISRGQIGMYEREKREEAPLSGFFP